MKFRQNLIAFFRLHGIADPVGHLAAAGDVNEDTIYRYCQQADKGVGRGEELLDPKIAGWLIYESEKMPGGIEANPVRDYLERKIADRKNNRKEMA